MVPAEKLPLLHRGAVRQVAHRILRTMIVDQDLTTTLLDLDAVLGGRIRYLGRLGGKLLGLLIAGTC